MPNFDKIHVELARPEQFSFFKINTKFIPNFMILHGSAHDPCCAWDSGARYKVSFVVPDECSTKGFKVVFHV